MSAVISGRVVRVRGWSVRIDQRATMVTAVVAAMTMIVAVWSLMIGDFPVAVSEVVRTITGTGSVGDEFIVMTLRLPRVLTGALVGAAFGVSGAMFQSLARNPLASPDVVGFNSGAALGAVITIVMVESAGTLTVSLGAVVGGLATAVLVYVCAYSRGVLGYRLILVGIGIGFAASAGVDYAMTRANMYDAQRAAVWLTGSLNNRLWTHVWPMTAGVLVLIPLACALTRHLRALELGDDTARALGVNPVPVRTVAVVVGVLLAALATAASGPIGFVALLSPPIARRLVRTGNASLLPSAACGALLTTVADLVARRLMNWVSNSNTELPVGILTAVIGGPYLLWLLSREIRIGAM